MWLLARVITSKPTSPRNDPRASGAPQKCLWLGDARGPVGVDALAVAEHDVGGVEERLSGAKEARPSGRSGKTSPTLKTDTRPSAAIWMNLRAQKAKNGVSFSP